MAQFKIGRLLVTVEWVLESDQARRKLARQVDRVAQQIILDKKRTAARGNRECSPSIFIERIKAYRTIVENGAGLKESKEWVEAAFADKGRGAVL